ncbi:MAG TPA: methyltransferase domain-containing protein [Pirellulaceae bacterium]|jgi:2-polyprenyl-3-methyl-5-hydroxy-6-metoxy-1,4-benzoquinol methylase
MLEHRVLVPEEMDDPAIATEQLQGALAGLRRLNFVSNSARIVWRPIERLARTVSGRRLRILDIATGSGDNPIALWRRARKAGLDVEIHGIDVSRRSVDLAREQAQAAGAPVNFECLNALTDELPPDFDVVMCSLFLHHLSDGNAQVLLKRMAKAARRLGLVSDLRRSAYGLFLAFSAGHLLSRSHVVHVDAVRSVQAAFTMLELDQLARDAGISSHQISRQWPCRMLLGWQGPHSKGGN